MTVLVNLFAGPGSGNTTVNFRGECVADCVDHHFNPRKQASVEFGARRDSELPGHTDRDGQRGEYLQ